ncbi:MAG TPA: AMP-binding protein [Allosphingosinicella sp.]
MYQVALTQSLFPALADTPFRPTTIAAMLREQARAQGDVPALRELLGDGAIGREWTYAELLGDCERLGRALAARHGRGARIAIFANNLPEWIWMELAAGFAGLTLVTVNPAFNARELRYVLEQSRAEAVYFVPSVRGNPLGPIVESACADLPAVRHRILLTDHDALFDGEEEGVLRETVPDDIVQIQYTSGTTGFPKGALLHQKGLIQNGFDAMHRFGVRTGDPLLIFMPLFHTAGCALLVLGGLATGGTLLLAPGFDPEMIARVIERERPTYLLGVPTMIVGLIDEAARSGRDLSSIKSVMSGGAMVAPELVAAARRAFGAPIQIVYGQTETSPGITVAWSVDNEADLSGTIGQPLPHMDVAILSTDDRSICPIGVQGEICCRGYNVMAGYNDNDEATAAAICPEGWLHTGDLGTMDARGYLRITGRVKDLIIRGGENVYPAEIENAMLEHEAILEAAVVGIPDDTWGELVACFMRARGAERPAPDSLKAFIRERLSPQKTPAYWIWVDQWPLTGSGKIQKFALREAFVRGDHQPAAG